MTSIIYDCFVLDLWYQHCNVLVEITDAKYRLLSKHFQRTQQHGGCNNNNNNNNNNIIIIMSSSYHMEQKTFVEAICTNNIHTGEKLFAAATFEGSWVVSFQAE